MSASTDMRRCSFCGYSCKAPGEYHPHSFCILVKAGYSPWDVVRAAYRSVAPGACATSTKSEASAEGNDAAPRATESLSVASVGETDG